MTPFWVFLLIGAGLLVIELLVFQFTTFWLFFVGLGALVAAAFAWISGGAGFISTTAVFVVASVGITAVLYTPIKRWQAKPSAMQDSDAVGQRVTVNKPISPNAAGTVTWSGTDWPAELPVGSAVNLESGQTARVVKADGIRLIVESV